MLKNKLLLSSLFLCVTVLPVCADTISELEFPKPPAYRVGISELPETRYVQAEMDKLKPEKKYVQINGTSEAEIADLTYADLSIKRLSKEISQELEYEEQDMLADLSLLWQGAAIQSDTINFALYKLANPDADKPDEKSVKKVLKTIASMSTLVGASMGSPVLAGSSLIGGNILGIMSQDTKALNYKYTRVNDADMIILIRKVEDLQQRAVDLYYDYMSAKKQLEFANDLVAERKEKFNLAQKNNAARELVVITDAYYRTALDKQRSAKSEFFSKRAALEQFVGNEAFVQFEADLTAREKGEKPSSSVATTESLEPSTPVQEEYANTIKTVETFTKDLTTSDSDTHNSMEQEMPTTAVWPDFEQDGELTGSSSNIENEDVEKKGFLKKLKRSKKDEVSDSVEEQNVKKYPKNSTKDLIFLHKDDQSSEKSVRRSKKNKNVEIEDDAPILMPQTKTQPKPVVDTMGLPPLDEIKVPELTRGGYSIHSEYYGEINDGEPSVQY